MGHRHHFLDKMQNSRLKHKWPLKISRDLSGKVEVSDSRYWLDFNYLQPAHWIIVDCLMGECCCFLVWFWCPGLSLKNASHKDRGGFFFIADHSFICICFILKIFIVEIIAYVPLFLSWVLEQYT